jgi:hypothetical protein
MPQASYTDGLREHPWYTDVRQPRFHLMCKPNKADGDQGH